MLICWIRWHFDKHSKCKPNKHSIQDCIKEILDENFSKELNRRLFQKEQEKERVRGKKKRQNITDLKIHSD